MVGLLNSAAAADVVWLEIGLLGRGQKRRGLTAPFALARGPLPDIDAHGLAPPTNNGPSFFRGGCCRSSSQGRRPLRCGDRWGRLLASWPLHSSVLRATPANATLPMGPP